MKKIVFLMMAALLVGACGNPERERREALRARAQQTLDFAVEQGRRMAESLIDRPGRLPKSIRDGKLEETSSAGWVSGFFPGELWYLYEYSSDEELRRYAEEYTSRVEDQQYTTDNHDVGFMIFCSFGNGWRVTGNEAYLDVIRTASNSLCTRFNPVTRTIRSWDTHSWSPWNYAVIIDNMMNLEMLMWSADRFGEERFREIAVSHADATMKNHFRPDFSSYHVVSYDTVTGGVEVRQTSQGYSDESAWARGQAWGLYGYTMMYRFTHDARYLEQAKHIARFLLDHKNLPEDKIPYWDFDAPDIPDALRDVSAGAIICSALLELSDYVQEPLRDEYMAVAERQIEALCSPDYLAGEGENCNFLLKHGVGNHPKGTEIDVPLSYADYYFVEALMRYLEKTK
ncbi:MAG: glycoside hydrolase family 88 protein [Rikenellaceae bacterium]|nr:glycoside hydrolase family 88 protein [Rikenellaceae bacterium]